MAAETRGLKHLPQKSRLRNPLNVVVEKVGATRAMVHGDVSAESLKELLMSSLSLLPTTKGTKDRNDDDGSKKSGTADQKTGLKDRDGEGGSGSSSENIDKETRGIVPGLASGISADYDEKGQKIRGKKSGGIHDGDIQVSDRQFTGLSKTGDKTRSGNKTTMNSGTKFGGGSSFRGDNGEWGEDVIEEGPTESLESCVSGSSTEKSSLSHDGRWLRKHFGKPLVWGLRDVAKNKPLDAVCYLAFWLRKYRSDEEIKKRRMDFDNELQTKRLLIRSQRTKQEESMEHLESEYYGDGEEGGGRADWNFKNYDPGSDRSAVTSDDTVEL